jgi:prepilin-type N-terminal cleavage/methylation domain-containing protein
MSCRKDGFSLPELLAVMALIAISIGIGIPIVNEQVRIAEVRAAADDLAGHLRAARMISVTQHKTITFTVNVDPTNTFSYEGNNGRTKTIATPGRVRIATASDRSINFKKNGSVDNASSIILESDVSGARERWTTTVSTMGLAKLAHERVN